MLNKKVIAFLLLSIGLNAQVAQKAQNNNYVSKVWVADNGDGTYKNPILHADYSDPDVLRDGDDYYMTSSSFNHVPGLPILHSKDLVNWKLIGNVFLQQPPYELFKSPQHGSGCWAPAIRKHKNKFYIYYPDPDQGIYVVTATSPIGPWSTPLMIKNSKGWIDPCPFWDTDGKAYLINGMSGSRSSIKSVLILNRMNDEGTKLLDEGVLVYDGHDKHPTIEGPKLDKINGYYYIMAPAGGVGEGWQLALRSKNIYGPYEEKVVLEQGSTRINGAHQGAFIDTPDGKEWWFIHFQDKDAYGRILHLQPVKWEANWPVIGVDFDKNGVGEPVETYKKPNVGKIYPIATPLESDEFNDKKLGLQWQFPANNGNSVWYFPSQNYGVLRLFNKPIPEGIKNFWDLPNVLTQKFPAPDFTVTTKFTFKPKTDNEKIGLMISGYDYSYLSVKNKSDGFYISQSICTGAEKGSKEVKGDSVKVEGSTFYFKVEVRNVSPESPEIATKGKATTSKWGNAICKFSYSIDGKTFNSIGEPFWAKRDQWIGSKVGLFAVREGKTYETGYADFDWFRVDK